MPGDDAGLVLGRDRGVLAGRRTAGERPGVDHRGEVNEPFGEERRPQVRDGDRLTSRTPARRPSGRGRRGSSRPGAPRSATCSPPLDAGLPGRLGEVGGRLDDPGADRVDEVGPADALYRRPHRVQVEVVAGDRPPRPCLPAASNGRRCGGRGPGPWRPFWSSCSMAYPPVSPVAPVIRIFRVFMARPLSKSCRFDVAFPTPGLYLCRRCHPQTIPSP